MTRYRLYLGGKRGSEVIPRSEIEQFFETFVDRTYEGYSRYETDGVWHGQHEPCTVVEFMGDRNDRGRIAETAYTYASKFGQESVLVTQEELDRVDFIGAEGYAEPKAA